MHQSSHSSRTGGRFTSLLFIAAALAALLLTQPPGLSAQSTGSISGRVVDGAGVGLADVQLFVVGSGGATLSNAEGRFVITGIPAGVRELLAERLGFGSVRMAVDLTPGGSVSVEVPMVRSAISVPGIVVTATRDARPLGEVAAAVGVVDRSQLEEVRPSHPAEIMGKIAGVWVNVTGGEGHMTAIRQPLSTSPLYLYLENGVPTRSTGFFNHNALYEINVPQADRIEVMKGPANALYGSDAIGGVVNVETRPPVAGEGLTGSVEGGSWGYSRILGSASGVSGANAFRVEGNYTRTDGWRAGTGYDRISGTARWDRMVGSWSVKSMVSFSNIDQKTAGSSALSVTDFQADPRANYTPISFRKVGAVRVSSEIAKETAGGSLTITPFFRSNSMDILPNWSLTFDPAIWETGNRSIGVLTKWRRNIADGSGFLIAGLDLDWSPGEHLEQSIVPERVDGVFVDYADGAALYDYEVTFRQASPYLHVEFEATDRLRVSGGLRVDALGYDYTNNLSTLETGSHRRPADASPSFTSVSPKLGATWRLSETGSLFASYRQGFRAPSEGQLFRQGSAENTVGLDPETSRSWEMGIRGQLGGRVRADLTLYRMDVQDAVLGFRLQDGRTENQNAGETLHQGVEVGFGALLGVGVQADVAFSYARHTYEEWSPRVDQQFAGFEMESAPRTISNVELRWQPTFLPSVRAAIEWNHLGSYYLDPENKQEYEGHNLMGFRASWQAIDGVGVFARVHNLTDERYAERASYNAFRGIELAPGLPRTFYLGLEIR